MSKPVRVTPPVELPVTLDTFKEHARIDFSDDDTVVQTYLDAAVAYLDGDAGVLGRCIVTQVWRQGYCGFQQQMMLPFPDVTDATVTCIDASGQTVQIPAGDYAIRQEPCGSVLVFADHFVAPEISHAIDDPVQVEFTAGFGAASEVPASLCLAILILAATWYRDREASGEPIQTRPFTVDAMIAPYRVWRK